MIYLTGASGFIGRNLFSRLSNGKDFFVISAQRQSSYYDIDELITELKGVSVVIHLAGISSVRKGESTYKDQICSVNVGYSVRLAKAASEAGVQRFIFISSVKVSGESSTGMKPFDEDMPPAPEDLYGHSKYEAEKALQKVAAETGIELVIIRPPLVYGPGVKANFNSLLKLCSKSAPLPFGLVNNQRSMVYLGNLVDFITRCIDHPNAANQTFLISDGQDTSLNNLIKIIRRAMNKSVWLVPVPVSLFKLVGRLTGKMGVVDRLVGDLQVDSRKAQRLLDWKPPFSITDGIKETVADFNNKEQ